jgi:purine-cytosine permease-like protein
MNSVKSSLEDWLLARQKIGEYSRIIFVMILALSQLAWAGISRIKSFLIQSDRIEC